MKKKVIEQKVKELVKLLKYFEQVKGIPYAESGGCPLIKYNHYKLSEAISGLGCWKWNCVLCGQEEQE